MSGYEQDGAQSAVGQAQEKVQETVQQASGAATAALRTQVEQRSTQVGSELQAVAGAMRRSGHSLRADGNESAANAVDGVAQRLEQLSRYLAQTDGDRLLHDVESFGRRRPWPLIGIGMAVGLAGSRFLKASSRRRYDAGYAPALPAPTPPARTVPPAVPQAVGSAPVGP
jgi:ElaB/YqjD/DUF883 family membrane-anchored ribosome-binding protein